MWIVASHSTPVACKEYRCDAAERIARASLPDTDYSPADLAVIRQAAEQDNKILPGMMYVKIKGLWDGEWQTFRARPDLDDICRFYGLYPDE